MKLSVVIPTKDRAAHLDRNLAALRENLVLPDEIFIVDCGLGPETRNMWTTWASRWAAIRYLAVPNGGASKVRNFGAASASGDLILFVDDDCLVDQNWVERIVAPLRTDPDAWCVTGRVFPFGTSQGQVAIAITLHSDRRERQGEAVPWGIGGAGNMAIRREAFNAIGGFDEELGPGTPFYASEDIDLFYRVMRAGGKIVYQPDAIIYHDQWRSRSQARTRKAQYDRGIAAFLLKHVLVHGDSFALRLLLLRFWEDVPLLAWKGLTNRTLELGFVSLYQLWGLYAGTWRALQHYRHANRVGQPHVDVVPET